MGNKDEDLRLKAITLFKTLLYLVMAGKITDKADELKGALDENS